MPKRTNGVRTLGSTPTFTGFDDGDRANPGMFFDSERTLGWYRPAADVMRLSSNDTDVLTINSAGVVFEVPITGLVFDVGSAAAPGAGFDGYANYGFYLDTTTTDGVAIATAGVKRLKVDTATVTATVPWTIASTADGTTVNGTDGSLRCLGGASIAKSIRAGGGFIGDNGAVNDVTYGINGEYGLYNSGSSLNIGSTTNVLETNTATTTTLNHSLLHPNGSAGTPSISFASDTNTGLYQVASHETTFTIGGTFVKNITGSYDRNYIGQMFKITTDATSGFVITSDQHIIVCTYNDNVSLELPDVTGGQEFIIINHTAAGKVVTVNQASSLFDTIFTGGSNAATSYAIAFHTAAIFRGHSSNGWCVWQSK